MTINDLEKQLQEIASRCSEDGIAFLATAIQQNAPDDNDAITVCQVLGDKSGCIPLAALCEDAAVRLKEAAPPITKRNSGFRRWG